jgi:methionine synthase II (cobalamin-independent)
MDTENSSSTLANTAEENRLPTGLALAIGSMPHRDSGAAFQRILEACPEAPCWPQLPALGFQENMMTQFSEGIPCIRVDWEQNKIFFARPEACAEELTRFYEEVMHAEESGDLSPFALSESYARGLRVFLDRLAGNPEASPRFVKGQITGPLTFGLTILDEAGLPALFDETLEDVVRKGIFMKALWQIAQLEPWGEKRILFVDEPILAAFGSSAYINLTREQAVTTLKETFSAVQSKGALVGSHCCGNTDWSLMVEAGVDIINFDAYVYMDTIGLYAESLAEFLDRGGYLAWGIVPSQSLEVRPTPEDLLERLEQGIDGLCGKGLSRDRLLKNLVLTTSCGLGTLTEEEAEAALREMKALQDLVRERLAGSSGRG